MDDKAEIIYLGKKIQLEEERGWKHKRIWNYVFFVMSAVVVAGGLVSVWGNEKTDFVSLTGWLMAAFWLLSSRIWVGMACAHREAYYLLYSLVIEKAEEELRAEEAKESKE